MTERPAVGAVILDEVEYYPPGMLSGPTIRKYGQIYMGAGPRKSDGITCLAVMAPGAERRHNIEVGAIVAVTIDGVRHVPETPPSRYNIRGQELIRIIEGDFSEEWARLYFDPASPKFFRANPPDAPSSRTLPHDAEHVVEIDIGEIKAPKPAGGSRWVLWMIVIIVAAGAAWLIRSR